MAVIETQGINLEGIEDVFRICGRQTGMAALDQRISEYVKAHDPRILGFLKDMEKYIPLLKDGSLKQEILLNFQKILLVFIK